MIRSAYHFTNMLLYRGFLLHDFTSRVPNAPAMVPSELGQKCRDAAISMAELASEFANDDTYNPVFWVCLRNPVSFDSKLPTLCQGTSHFIFCSIAILVVSLLVYDDRATLEAVIESGMKAHMKLSNIGNTQRQRLLEVCPSSNSAFYQLKFRRNRGRWQRASLRDQHNILPTTQKALRADMRLYHNSKKARKGRSPTLPNRGYSMI